MRMGFFLREQQRFCHRLRQQPLRSSLHHVPTLQDLEGKFRKIRRGKASGPDGLPGEAFRAAPVQAAQAYFGLVSKVTIFGADPLQWRGGIVKAIFKRGPTHDPASWRNILLSSIPGKAAHSLIRDALNQCYQDTAHTGQVGGKAGASIQVPTMGVRSYQRWCKTHRRSYALIFVDGIEAFYRMVRELCFQYHDYDGFVKTLERTHASAKLQDLILQNARKLPALDQAGAPQHLVDVTRALHNFTWFVCEQQIHKVALTTRGSRPGDPIADVLFNLVISRAMRQIEEKLREKGLLETLGLQQDQPLPFRCRGYDQVSFCGQAWVDDLLFMTSSDDPHEITSKVASIVTIAQQELATMGIEINLKQGKSEALIHMAGRDSRQLRRALHLEQGSQIMFQDIDGNPCSLHVGQRYKYLGSILAPQGTCAADIKHRAGQAFAALKLIRRTIFRNHALQPRIKQQALHSVILSKMMATSGAWIFDTKSIEQCFFKTIMRIYRYVFALTPGWSKDRHYSHSEIIEQLGVLWPEELLHIHRLRGLISAVKLGTLHVWALLQAD